MVDVSVDSLGSLLVSTSTEHMTNEAMASATAILPAVTKV